ncbi:MAG: aminopeptidase N [Gammaproteobacteria bacterium]|nr:aminopeptidase N [Gammaproteobacteria bacterium]
MQEEKPQTIRLKDYQVPVFGIDRTRLHVDIGELVTTVTTTLEISRNPLDTSGSRQLMLDGGRGLVTRKLALDGRELMSNEFTIDDETLSIPDVAEKFTFTSVVEIKPQDNLALEGLYRSGDMFCSQCEAEGFRNITWYMDRPDVMAAFETTIVANKKSFPVLLSNGNLVGHGEESDKHWATWEDPFRKPAYLFALVAGDLDCIEDEFVTMSGRKIVLQIFTERHNIDKVDFAMASLKQAMTWDEQFYGREYDLDIFMIVAVESFNMGAMENKGLNVFNTSCVLARPDTTTDAGYQRVESVIAHEYFHNWSGNRVTCRDWFQLSLKEGFTVFRDQQFSAFMGSDAVCRMNDVAMLRTAQFPEDAGPMAHSIRPDAYMEINNFYTATVYEKGAEVVRMISTLVGPDGFRKGTDLYFDRHDGQAVTTDDFVTAIEDANSIDLNQFRRWYSQAGTPQLQVTGEYDADGQCYRLRVRQSCPPTPGQTEKPPLHLPLAIGLLGKDGADLVFSCAGAESAYTENADGLFTMVMSLTAEEQVFELTDVTEAPVPSLLRRFSAPVKLDFDYSRDELTFLMSHDNDGFNRWEASQRLAVDVIIEMVKQHQAGEAFVVDARLLRAMEVNLNEALKRDQEAGFDKAMIANMLVLPSETYLAELFEVADIDAIHRAREELSSVIAISLKEALLSVYNLNKESAEYVASATAIASRLLRNVALSYLMKPADTDQVSLCENQFDTATNMTDTSAAIRALVNSSHASALAIKPRVLSTFYDRWADEALVIDQWFAIQASCPLPGALDRVKVLMQHPAFDLKKPNRMRSLITSFASQNTVNFHHLDGSGYGFLADCVIELDRFNPQIAARMLTPLTRWRKLDRVRQQLIKDQLQKIRDSGDLSKDVFEVVSKSL